MKNLNSLQLSYQKQKSIFDEAKSRRIANRAKEINLLREKLNKLNNRISELERANTNEREFESFESFRTKAEAQSKQSETPSTSN